MVRVLPGGPEESQEVKFPRVVALINVLAKILGVMAMNINVKKKQITFKLCSCTSMFTFIRLLTFHAPLMLIPIIIEKGGYLEDELQKVGSNGTSIGIYKNQVLAQTVYEQCTKKIRK